MLSGYNNNIMIAGEVFHIQTEDGGTKNPVISTVVFKDGQVVLSKKTNYADIIKFEELGLALRNIMKDQHIATLKALRDELNSKGVDNARRTPEKVVNDVQENKPFNENAIDDIIRSYLKPDNVKENE